MSSFLASHFSVGGELDGQPIEQVRVGRQLAADAEIVRRFHQAEAENLFPVAIDRHPRRQGIGGAHEPVGQLQAVGRAGPAWRLEQGRHAGADLLALVEEVAANQDVRLAPLLGRQLAQDRRGHRLDGASCFAAAAR